MRTAMWGALGGAVCSWLVVGLLIPWSMAWAQLPADARGERYATDQLMALPGPASEGKQQITLIDPKARVMGVYAVDAHGAITLKSVRNVHWDLLMEEFNGSTPAPREIRSLLQQR